ncbi:MAG: DRTGG domain-containing protein [Thermovirgaceae bacterium]|jgi:predicted transcriptional regulator|nr:DRTGG domain-containing protein [Synergistales bacterium]MDI9393512.1 DRTGG domain-containing protein [Synergistota bacterium]MDY0179205.1 DRTGG domain-containing protein [Synergistaceae bacterium]HRW87737.1 DRTGG domain-containing protein [Thermovirgaceae bacterium]MDD3133330.1 DRTGG domain-containing protein [Synergistales bacterium]
MLLGDIMRILEAEPLSQEINFDVDLLSAFAADLMSDVLALARPGTLMITGLTNIQIVRTASMVDMPAVVFVRGKKPPRETIELAEKLGIPFIMTSKTMFETCGVLYQAGIKPIRCLDR